jgi:hypothetical protein
MKRRADRKATTGMFFRMDFPGGLWSKTTINLIISLYQTQINNFSDENDNHLIGHAKQCNPYPADVYAKNPQKRFDQ